MAYVRLLKDSEDRDCEIRAYYESGWTLCLQYGCWHLDDGETYEGFRFIWRRPDRSLQPARGQARIPSLKVARELMRRAADRGWGDRDDGEPFRFVTGD